ncbi:MAG: exodeoxyribonuclease V subunit alpha [Proteobacteria bacterium]|nr:exodeoxyribonuclease V subunit alpha [Pseudomonadota bacterium]
MKSVLETLQKSGRLQRADAALGEWVARGFPDAPPETALAAALAARAVADGHSALALDQAQAWFAGLDGEGKPPTLPGIVAWRKALRDASCVHLHTGDAPSPCVPLVLDAQDRIYLRRYFEYERQLAHALIARTSASGGSTPLPKPPARAEQGGDESGIDPEQQRAIEIALAHRFTLVTGGPGTGKTHGVVRMLAALAAHAHAQGTELRIAMAAPTGKAAARLRESVRAQLDRLHLPAPIAACIPDAASTLHRLLGLSPWSPRPRHGRTTTLPFDVVVVDEVSMVDLPLMAKLVAAVPANAHLVLLGDPDQLSAVEAGNVLGALVDAANNGPLLDCHVALTRSHRFAAGSPLGALAAAIAQQGADAAIAVLERGDGVALVDEPRIARLADHAADAYRAVLDATGPGEALRAARSFRVLTALRRGPSGCLALDDAIAARLKRHAGVRADAAWWRGRLVLVTANRAELGLFNGDTGVVWPDEHGVPQAWFEGAEGALRRFAPAALPANEGAFALTVHKAQGSEFERVALVTGPDSAVLTRELLYTGVTRARSAVTLYTTPEILRAGIGRRTLRMTGLADRLRETQDTNPERA